MISNARQELESYFAAERERRAAKLEHLRDQLKQMHHRDQLRERAPLADHALGIVEQHLGHWSMLTEPQRAALARTRLLAGEKVAAWRDQLFDLNHERMALAILDALLVVEVPEVPVATDAELERYQAGHGFIEKETGRRGVWVNGTQEYLPPKPDVVVWLNDGQGPGPGPGETITMFDLTQQECKEVRGSDSTPGRARPRQG
jgi:hypothetical protein